MIQFCTFEIRARRPRWRCPSGAQLMSRRVVCARLEARSLPCCCRSRAEVRPRLPRRRPVRQHRRSSDSRRFQCGQPVRPVDARPALGRLLGDHPLQVLGVPAGRRQSSSFLDVFRRSNKFSEVQAVCRSLSDSPLVGLFQAGYAELTAQLRQGGQTDPATAAGPSAGGRRSSYSEESGRRGSCADARVGRRGQQARAPRTVPGDDGEHRAVHRAVRHGVGHHDGVPEHRRRTARPTSRSSHPGLPKRSSPRPPASSRPFRR